MAKKTQPNDGSPQRTSDSDSLGLHLPERVKFESKFEAARPLLRKHGFQPDDFERAYRGICKAFNLAGSYRVLSLKQERETWEKILSAAAKLEGLWQSLPSDARPSHFPDVDGWLTEFIGQASDYYQAISFRSPFDHLDDHHAAEQGEEITEISKAVEALETGPQEKLKDRGIQPAKQKLRFLLYQITLVWFEIHPPTDEKPVSWHGTDGKHAGPLLKFVVEILDFEGVTFGADRPKPVTNEGAIGAGLLEVLEEAKAEVVRKSQYRPTKIVNKIDL